MSGKNGDGSNFSHFRHSGSNNSPSIVVDLVTRFNHFSKFAKDIEDQTVGDIGSMILHIHPKLVDVEQNTENKFKIIINMDQED